MSRRHKRRLIAQEDGAIPSPGAPAEGEGGGVLAHSEQPPPQPSPGVPEEGEKVAVVEVEQAVSEERDAGAIDASSFPEHPFPEIDAPRLNHFQVVIKRSALKTIHRHGESRLDVEVCGVLVGNVYHDRAGPFLVIQAIIQGNFAANNAAQVTFTAETWQHIQEKMETKHPDKKIVGWYHTHPGFGIFLSKMDLFIHENFFNIAWQTAIVYDPKSGEEGLFVWRKGLTEREPILVEEDWAAAMAADDEPVPGQPSPAAPIVDDQTIQAIKKRLRGLEKRNKFLIIGLLLLALLAAAWPFVLYTIMSGGNFDFLKRPFVKTPPPATSPR